MRYSNVEIVVSKYYPLKRDQGAFCRNGRFQIQGRESARLDWHILVCQKAKKCSRINGDKWAGKGSWLTGAPTSQIWDNLNINRYSDKNEF